MQKLQTLVYGMEAVLPIEVEISSLRSWPKPNWRNLMDLERLYQKRIKNAFDQKARPQVFKEGNLVLKKILPNAKGQRGKWAPNYEGPYVVKHAFSGGVLILTNVEG
ncbi:hypothetical protein CR513_51689, partial [Mucuna pruriens]